MLRATRVGAFGVVPRLTTSTPRPVPPFALHANTFTTSSAAPWTIPDYIKIPEDQLEFKFIRSSGAGGQKVNKVSTCVQVKFHVASAAWMGPFEVRQRFQRQQSRYINKDGYYVLQAQQHRTQPANRKAAVDKVQQGVMAAWPRPVQRNQRPVGYVSEGGKERRKQDKKRHSIKKESRRRVEY